MSHPVSHHLNPKLNIPNIMGITLALNSLLVPLVQRTTSIEKKDAISEKPASRRARQVSTVENLIPVLFLSSVTPSQ